VSIYRNSSNSQPSSPYEIDNAIVKVCVSGMVEMATTPYLQAIWQQLQAGRADSVQWQQDAFWRSQLSGEYPIHPGWRCLART
jgi:hypothetical protein